MENLNVDNIKLYRSLCNCKNLTNPQRHYVTAKI